jgi:formiminotetrahydrofolate cyclodeaminase
LQTSLQGAYLTIQINLKNIDDKDFVCKTKKESKIIFEKAKQIAEEVYQKAARITGENYAEN